MYGPDWFLGVDALFDTIFFFVTLTVAVLAYRAFRFFGKSTYRTLATGFGLLSASYLALALANLFVYFDEGNVQLPGEIHEIAQVITAGFLAHAILFLAGLVTLLILYHNIDQFQVKALLFTLVCFAFLLSGRMGSAFYALAAILFLFIITQLVRKSHAKPILAGFILLFLGEVLFSVLFLGTSLYVAAHVVSLLGFLSIIAGVRK